MQTIHALVGKAVRNADGRAGRIVGEHLDACHIAIDIVDQTGSRSTVNLNSDGPDSGDIGWSWNVAEDGDQEAWVVLGDHNSCMA